MIPTQLTLKRLINSRTNFFIYGPRAIGKTTIIKDVFKKTQVDYIYINCTIADKKANFFKYLNHELNKFLKVKGQILKYDKYQQDKKPQPNSIYAWIQNIRDIPHNNKQKLHRIYFFIDNIQQLLVSANFLTTFYTACQQSLQGLKISFVFCGINLPNKMYAVDKPFRNIISFCMGKSQKLMKFIINSTINAVVNKFIIRQNQHKLLSWTQEDIAKGIQRLTQMIYHSFQPIQSNFNKIKKMAYVLTLKIVQYLKRLTQSESKTNKDSNLNKTFTKQVDSFINKGQFKQFHKQMIQNGYVQDFLVQRKINQALKDDQFGYIQLKQQFYPTLIMSSLYMADQAGQSQDKRRFQDYKKEKGNGRKNFGQYRTIKQTLQRVVAISQVFQSIHKKGPQFHLKHHSLRFYACLQHLREQGKLSFTGKSFSFNTTKINGQIKQEEAKKFLKTKMDVIPEQFMPAK